MEDALTPDALLHGHKHSEQPLGFTQLRELSLTLTDQPPAFYSAPTLAYWRTVRPPPKPEPAPA